MSGIATAIGGTAVLSYLGNRNNTNAAVNAQVAGGREANQISSQRYAELLKMFQPYLDTGGQAFQDYAASARDQGPEAYQINPFDQKMDQGFEFRMAQANKALARRQAAGGQFSGGRAARELSTMNQDLASQEYGNAYNRYLGQNQLGLAAQGQAFNQFNQNRGALGNVAQMGMGALGQIAGYGQNNANQMGNNVMGIGNSQAAGYMANSQNNNNLFGSLSALGMN